jgi:hypothetical protein
MNDLVSALLNVVVVAAGFFVVMSIWLGIQAYARRRGGCAKDRDMLDYMLNGCASCRKGGNCSSSKERARIV